MATKKKQLHMPIESNCISVRLSQLLFKNTILKYVIKYIVHNTSFLKVRYHVE